jgi:hypothetical protein
MNGLRLLVICLTLAAPASWVASTQPLHAEEGGGEGAEGEASQEDAVNEDEEEAARRARQAAAPPANPTPPATPEVRSGGGLGGLPLGGAAP